MTWNRRTLLKGAGAAVALPLMDSLLPRRANGAPAPVPTRFLTVFFPDGRGPFWLPEGTGSGDDWQLSALLEPFASLKQKMTVITNLENYSCLSSQNENMPGHSRTTGAFLTCVDADRLRDEVDGPAPSFIDGAVNAESFDQLLARSWGPSTRIGSLQLGLSAFEQSCDGRHCEYSRSISWASATDCLFKEINPGVVYDQLVQAEGAYQSPHRRLARKSILDAVLENATATRARLGAQDRRRMDEFMTSVRSVERRIDSLSRCEFPERPMGTFGEIDRETGRIATNLRNGTSGYDRGVHSQIMNDLIVLALRCDATRVISHMLDDARSEFIYDHLTTRVFAEGHVEAPIQSAYHGLINAGETNAGWATIVWWLTSQCADICRKLDSVEEGEGTLLDHTVVYYASQMNNNQEAGSDLPVVLIGGKALGLRQDAHVVYGEYPGDPPLRDLYFTLANDVFDVPLQSFGEHHAGAPHRHLTEILA